MLWLNKGKYNVIFRIEKKGILCRYTDEQIKKNQLLNQLTFFAGMAKGNYSAAGAAILASSRQLEFFSWKQLKSIKFKDNQHVILLNGGWGFKMVVFTPEEQYEQIKSFLLTIKPKS